MSYFKRIRISKNGWGDAGGEGGRAGAGLGTPEGMAVPSTADLRHDLLAETTVLKTESPEAFTELFAQYLRAFDPASPAEYDLIDDMTSAAWRIRRLWTVETSLMDGQTALQTSRDPVTAMAGSLTALADTPRFHQLSRYESRLHRVYQQALRNLLVLQRRRVG